jgi:hypothetical protein
MKFHKNQVPWRARGQSRAEFLRAIWLVGYFYLTT